jgi:hypothetical protein
MNISPLWSFAILSFVSFPARHANLDIRKLKFIICQEVVWFKSQSGRANFDRLTKVFMKERIARFNSIFWIFSQQPI